METYRCDLMGAEETGQKMLAVAISAVLLEESIGFSIAPSVGRGVGNQWSISHRRISMGKSSLLKSRSGRSANR